MPFENPDIVRVSISTLSLVLFFCLGLAFSFRKSPWLNKKSRWLVNLSFSFGNALMVKFLVPISLIQLTEIEFVDDFKVVSLQNLPTPASLVIGLLLLDCMIYWQHRLFHKTPFLWRIHRMHHSDPEIDTTTAGRFHPIEIIISFGLKAVTIILFDISALAVFGFEVLLNFSSLFNHTNIQIPKKFESLVQKIVITPDLHRIHHSRHSSEMNSNFGFSISLWDQLFKSFLNSSRQPQRNMPMGLTVFQEEKDQSFFALLRNPFSNK